MLAVREGSQAPGGGGGSSAGCPFSPTPCESRRGLLATHRGENRGLARSFHCTPIPFHCLLETCGQGSAPCGPGQVHAPSPRSRAPATAGPTRSHCPPRDPRLPRFSTLYSPQPGPGPTSRPPSLDPHPPGSRIGSSRELGAPLLSRCRSPHHGCSPSGSPTSPPVCPYPACPFLGDSAQRWAWRGLPDPTAPNGPGRPISGAL